MCLNQYTGSACKIKHSVKQSPAGLLLFLDQWEAYSTFLRAIVSREISLGHLLELHGRKSDLEITWKRNYKINDRSGILQISDVSIRMITNFHQPKSTLLLLVAAFIGEDWKELYRYAMENDFRFLSYGDSSILVPEKS